MPGKPYQLYPNIVCVDLQIRTGADPGVARFRYQFNPSILGSAFPDHVEDVLGFNARGPFVVPKDQRLVILILGADGSTTPLYDVFCDVPQGDLGPGDTITFQGRGRPVREWDTPLPGALIRQGPDPTVVSDVPTGLPVRFNPDGIGNATPVGADAGDGLRKYPTFCDIARDPNTRQIWTIAQAAKYIITQGNPLETYTNYFNDLTVLDPLLAARAPKSGNTYDPNKPATYTSTPIPCHDLDVSGDPWPVALGKLLSPHGFGFDFVFSPTGAGIPYWFIDIWRLDGGNSVAPKPLMMQAPGVALDPGQTNTAAIAISRDSTQIRNAVTLDTEPVEYEVSLILAPGFIVDSSLPANLKQFIEGDVGFTGANIDKYRTFVYSEAGDGYWDFPTSAFMTTATLLDAVLGSPKGTPPVATYSKHRRVPGNKLFTLDDLGKPRHARLDVSKDYGTLGVSPAVWDGESGTWQQVPGGCWDLLPDRLGIRFTNKDPNDVAIGLPPEPTTTGFSSGKLRLVKALSAPDTANPKVFFRLTCTIKSDQDILVNSPLRAASSTSFTVSRRVDARDRFQKHVIDASSVYNDNDGLSFNAIDDTKNAQAYADAVRAAHEMATFAGTVTIKRITQAYTLGDKITGIIGRNISFQTNSASEQGEGSQYPIVVAISWTFDGKLQTSLHLSDRRGEPAPEHDR